MKLDTLRSAKRPRLMIIPMIDIILFLLVFFMMSTLYMVEQRVLPVVLPEAVSGKTELSRQVVVTVTAQGNVLFNQESMPMELLAKRVQVELVQQDDTAFMLRADRNANYGAVIAVLDELKRAGVRKIAIATDPKAR